jgi:hypothetical protein
MGAGDLPFYSRSGGGALLVTAQTIITESYPIAKEGWHKPSTEWIVGPTLAHH